MFRAVPEECQTLALLDSPTMIHHKQELNMVVAWLATPRHQASEFSNRLISLLVPQRSAELEATSLQVAQVLQLADSLFQIEWQARASIRV